MNVQPDERFKNVSSDHAYLATLYVVTKLSWQLDDTTDLSTLIVDMELTSSGESYDGAVLHEWRQLWGSEAYRPPKSALEVAAKFVEMERYWSEEQAVKTCIDTLRAPLRDVPENPQFARDAWNLWITALSNTTP